MLLHCSGLALCPFLKLYKLKRGFLSLQIHISHLERGPHVSVTGDPDAVSGHAVGLCHVPEYHQHDSGVLQYPPASVTFSENVLELKLGQMGVRQPGISQKM